MGSVLFNDHLSSSPEPTFLLRDADTAHHAMLLVKTLCSADEKTGSWMLCEWSSWIIVSPFFLFVCINIYSHSFIPPSLSACCSVGQIMFKLAFHDLTDQPWLVRQQVDILRCTDWSRWGKAWKEALRADRMYSLTQDWLTEDSQSTKMCCEYLESRWRRRRTLSSCRITCVRVHHVSNVTKSCLECFVGKLWV